MEVRSALASVGQLTLLGDVPTGKFNPGTSYELETAWGGLQGDLGLFAPVDLEKLREPCMYLAPTMGGDSDLNTLGSPCERKLLAAVLFHDVAMPDDESLGRSLQHGVQRARSRRFVL